MMFALRHKKTKKLMSFSVRSNGDADFAGDNEYSLCNYGDRVWVVTNRKVAERAADNTSEWYNADYETPENEYVGDLEVVELTIK